jgi:hypothetical protein
VDSNHPELFAAIGAAGFAGTAFATTDVRLNRAAIANFYSLIVFGDVGNDPGEFVSQNSRVSVRRMPAGKGMKIAPAHSHGTDPDERFSPGRFRGRHLTLDKFSWSLQQDLSHGYVLNWPTPFVSGGH